MRKNFLLISITIIFLSSCTKEEFIPANLSNNPLITEMDIAVDDIYQKYRGEINTVGLSIGILKDSQIHLYGYGETKKGTGRVPDGNTFYEIGSITKVFTSIAIVKMLNSEGKTVDATIKPYLPSDIPTLNRNGIEVCFKHMLSHSSGLPYMPTNLGFAFYNNIAKGWAEYDVNKLYSSLVNVRLKFDPFTDYLYSNMAMGVLGVILERRFDKDYGEVIEQEILNPLGLSNTSAYFSRTDQSRWAVGYQNGNEVDYWKSLNALDGAGVLKSTASDMLIFAQQNISPPITELGEAMIQSQGLLFENSSVKVCHGWILLDGSEIDAAPFLFHDGGTGGFNSEFFISRESQSAIVLLFNTDGYTKGREKMIRDLLKLVVNP